MIASTFTVIHGMLFVGRKLWANPIMLWQIVIVDVTIRTIFFHSIPSDLGDGIFLMMDWIGAASSWMIWKEFGFQDVMMVVIGGLF